MPELISDRIWDAGDKVVIGEFEQLLFPENGNMQDSLPRNISARCAEVWNGHHVAYRCLTCGISPSSCICVACFNAGDHEGHDYFIYRSDYGGCCDCGDADAWDICGFCRYHRMAYEANKRNPCTNLPFKMKNMLRNILPVQLRRLCHHLEEWSKTAKHGDLPQECNEHIKFLLRLAQAHDGLRHIISEAFAKQQFEGSTGASCMKMSILEFSLRIGSNHLAKETELTNLFLDLMFDASFKRTFARIFLKLYPDLILNRSEVLTALVDEHGEDADQIPVGADPSSLDRVTVQLFSIRAITLELLEDPNVQLLDTLLSTTKALLLLACDSNSRVKYLVNNHSILTKRSYFQCTHDLRFVLDHQEVVDELFARHAFRSVLWNGWLEIWKIIQCANPHVRIKEDGEHVQHENQRWGNSLVFESDIHSASSSMIVTLENRVKAIDAVNWALVPLCKALRDWLAVVRQNEMNWYIALARPGCSASSTSSSTAQELAAAIKKFTPEDEEIAPVGCEYIVSKQPVSFHIPMHRIFASLMHSVCSSPNKDAIILEKADDAEWGKAKGERSLSKDGVLGGRGGKGTEDPEDMRNTMNDDEDGLELVCYEATTELEKDGLLGGGDVADAVNNGTNTKRNKSDKQLTVDTNLNSPPPKGRGTQNDSHANIEEGVSTPGVGGKKASSKSPSKTGNEDARGLFAQIVNSPKKAPAEKKQKAGVSSYLAKLERKGAPPEHDPSEGTYQLFRNTETLFRSVMGAENFTTVDLLHLMEHPLRCLVFHAQCYGFSSLWLRNGDSVAYEACFYKKNYWHSLFVDPDLTLIRLVMLALSETNQLPSFASTMLQRFEAGPRLVGHSVETLFLTLSQCLAVEPYTFKANDIERITEYHCIHILAKGPCTHSELTDTIMKSHDNSDFLDGILNDIADFQEPDAAVQAAGHRTPGKYILKLPLWRYVDTLFLLYSWKEQHEVEEKKLEKLGPKLANSFVPYRHWKEVEPYIVPCYRKGLQLIALEPCFVAIPIVSMLQACLLPVEMINHRGLQLALMLLQRLLVLVDYEKQMRVLGSRAAAGTAGVGSSTSTTSTSGAGERVQDDHNKRSVRVNVTEAGNVFALANRLSATFGNTVPDSDFDQTERHGRLTVVDAADIVIEIECADVNANCLARSMGSDNANLPVISRGPGAHADSLEDVNQHTESVMIGGQLVMLRGGTPPGSPSRRRMSGLQREPLTLENNPIVQAGGGAVVNGGAASSRRSSRVGTPNIHQHGGLTNDMGEEQTQRGIPVEVYRGPQEDPGFDRESRLMSAEIKAWGEEATAALHELLAEGGEGDAAAATGARASDHTTERKFVTASSAQQPALMQFSLMQCFEAILKEPSCKQHVHVVNQNLKLLELYGLFSSEKKKEEFARTQTVSTATPDLVSGTSSLVFSHTNSEGGTSSVATSSLAGGVSSVAMPMSNMSSIVSEVGVAATSSMTIGDAATASTSSTTAGTASSSSGVGAPSAVPAIAVPPTGATAIEVDQEGAEKPEMTEAEKKKEERKRKQAAMLKKFNKKQKSFLTTSDEAKSSTSPAKTAAQNGTAAADDAMLVCPEVGTLEHQAECVICFCDHPGERNGSNPLGRMAHLQKTCVSNVPRLKRPANGSSSPCKSRKRKRLSPQKSCPVDRPSYHMAGGGSSSVYSAFQQQTAPPPSGGSSASGGSVNTSKEKATTAAASHSGASSSSSSAGNSKEKIRRPDQTGASSGPFGTAGTAGAGAGGLSSEQLASTSSTSLVGPRGRQNSAPPAPLDSDMLENNNEDSTMEGDGGELSSSEESSACEQGLEDPNLKRTAQASELIEELEPEPPAAGLYVWSCGHKIHWDCWRRLRHGTMGNTLHCPYCNQPVHIFIPVNSSVAANGIGANKALPSAGGPVLRPAEQQDPLLAALNRSADVLDSQAAMTNLSSVAAAAGVPPAASASSTVENKPVSEEPPAPRPAPALDLQSFPAIERMRHLRMLDKQNSANQLEQLDGGLSPARGRGQRSQESEQKLSSTRQQELDLVVTVSWEEKIESLKQLEEWDQFFKSPLGYKHLTMAIKAAGNVSWSLKNRPNAVSPFYSFMDQIQNERQPIRAQYCLIPPQRSEILMHRDDHRRRGLLGGPGTLRGPRWTADLIRVAQNFQRRQQQETRAAGTTAGNDDARPVTTDGATLQVDAQGNVRNTAPDGGSRGLAAGAAAASTASSRVSAGPAFTTMDWSSTATAGAGEASSSSSQMPQQQMFGSTSSSSSGGPPTAESQGSSSSSSAFSAPLQQRFASSGSGSSSTTTTGAQQEQAPRTTTLSDREQAAQSLTSALFSAATATNAFGGSASSQEQASFVAALQQFSNFLSGPAGAALVRGADRLDRQETGLGGAGSGSASSGLGRGGGGRAGADTPDNFDVQSSRSSNGSGAVGRNASPGRGADRESSPVSNAANHSYEDADDLSFDPPGASGESGNNSSSSSYPWVESETGEQQAKRVRTENGNAAAGATSSSSSSGVGPVAQQQTQTVGGSSSSSSSSNFFQQRAAGSAGLVQPASGDRGASGGTGTINDDGANDSGFESALEVGSACSSADTAMSSTQAPASSSAISVSSFGAGAAPPNSNAGGTAGGAGDGAEARTDLLATGSTGRDRPFRNSSNGNGNAFFASDGRPAATGGVSWTGQAPSRRRSEGAGETGSATAIEDKTPAATTIASVPPVVGKKSESETMRLVMKSLSAHPVAILGSVLADQLRLDEIRLRAKGTFVLEPKRIEFLQGFVDAIRAYASANGAGIMSAAGNNNGPNKVPPPHPKSSVGSGGAAAASTSDLHVPPLSPPLNALPESAVSLPRSAAPGGAINALEMQQELRLLNGGRRSTDAGDATTGSAGGGATSSSSPKMKSPEPDRAAPHCHVDVDEPQFLATELLVRKIICTAIPCDPGVLHEWTTVGTVLSDDLATHAQTIALMHALKLIFATLESDFTFLQLPYFAPRFQTKPVVVSQPADRDGDVVMNIATVDANGKEITKRVVGTTGASSFSAGGGNGTLQTVTSSESIMSSSGQLGANGGLLTEESGASNAEDVLSSGVEPETSNEVGTTHHPSVVGSNQRGFLLSATSQRNGNRSAASSNSSLLNHAGSSVPGIGGITPTSGGASDEGDSTSFLVGSRSGGAAGGPRSLTELLAAQFNTLERGNSASADDEEEEDLFQLFDEEDKVAREEMRREKNELRRSAEVFALTEAEAKNLVAVAILPLLRRQCLLKLITGTGGGSGSRPGDKKASDSCTRESQDQQQNENLPPVDKLIREGTLKSTWDHACVLARHLGHDLDKLLLINNGAVCAASSPDAAMKYIWKKMSTAVDKWRSSARAQTRAAIEFVPSLNQRTKDEVTGRDIPYIRPRFAKNSLFIRLSAKQDYVNSYPGNYCAVTAALAMTSKNNDHIEQKLSLLAAASGGSSSSTTGSSSTSTSTPYSVMFTNRCFYLEFHPLSYGHGSTPQLFNAAGSAASGQSTPLSGGVSVQQAAVGVTRSAMQSSTAAQIAGQFVPESPRRSGVNSAVVPTSCNYNHNLGVLIKLPYLYQTLYTTYIHKQCPLCFPPLSTNVNQPKISFLCLLTGKHLCSASTFMEQYGVVQAAGGSANCENSFTKHAGKSGLGLSVLMNLLSGLVHIQKDEKMCVWGAIYLDAYGEEDRYLSRGKPLYLSQARLQQLTNALASHSFESDSKLLWKQLH